MRLYILSGAAGKTHAAAIRLHILTLVNRYHKRYWLLSFCVCLIIYWQPPTLGCASGTQLMTAFIEQRQSCNLVSVTPLPSLCRTFLSETRQPVSSFDLMSKPGCLFDIHSLALIPFVRSMHLSSVLLCCAAVDSIRHSTVASFHVTLPPDLI